jgi:hypothetical protein
MKITFMALMLVMLLYCPSVKAEDNLTAEDVKFLKSCNVQQADIEVIPKLPADGHENIQLVLESRRRNCDRPMIKSFKDTRDFLRKFTPPPAESPSPPAGYEPNFLTPEELKYITDINKRILDETFKKFSK